MRKVDNYDDDYWTKQTWTSIICRSIPLLLVALILGSSPIWADYNKPMKREDLPFHAKDMLDSKFPDSRVAFAAKEIKYLSRKYKVILADGTKLIFDNNGVLEEIDAKFSYVPSEFVPDEIMDYVKAYYPETKVVSLEIKRNVYKIDLSNSLELEFDKQYFFLTHLED